MCIVIYLFVYCSDVGDSPTDQVAEDPDSEVYPSEDESDTFEATVQFDFNARSDRELTLRKGENVVLFNQVRSNLKTLNLVLYRIIFEMTGIE